MSNELRGNIHAQILRTIRTRIDAVIKLPDDTQLSLACALNLLFLLRGEWGSIGDYMMTLKALRTEGARSGWISDRIRRFSEYFGARNRGLQLNARALTISQAD